MRSNLILQEFNYISYEIEYEFLQTWHTNHLIDQSGVPCQTGGS